MSRRNKRSRNYYPKKRNEPIDNKTDSKIKSVSTNVTKKENTVVTAEKTTNTQSESRYNKNRNNRRNKSNNNNDRRNSGNSQKFSKVSILNKTLKDFNLRIKQNNELRSIKPYIVARNEETVCKVCEKTIKLMSTAIYDDTDESYSHFDCIIRNLIDNNNLTSNERIAYIGNNIFAVIEDKDGSGRKTFKIKKRFKSLHEITI